MKTILMVNHWHDDNKGDSAITLATLSLFAPAGRTRVRVASMLPTGDPNYGHAMRHITSSRPDVQPEGSLVPSYGSSTSPAHVLRWAFRWAGIVALMLIGRVPGTVKAKLRGVDRLVLIGGSNIFDSGERFPFGTLRLLQVIYPAWAAQRLGIPVVLLGHTLGPFKTRLSRRLVRTVLTGCDSIVLREEKSLTLARELDPDLARICRVEPDMAFGMPTPAADERTRLLRSIGLRDESFMVFIPRTHPYLAASSSEALLQEMAASAQWALDSGVVDRVVVLAQCLGPSEIEDDRDSAGRLVDLIDRPATLFVAEDLSPDGLMAIFSAAVGVVSVRLHGAILAMAAGTPAHAIAYFTAKTSGVLEQCGLADQWSEFEGFERGVVEKLLEADRKDRTIDVSNIARSRLVAVSSEFA